MSFAAIVHCDATGLMGIDGKLAYRSSEDLNEFKAQTLGNQTILVMGRNTYKECGNLPERTILALSAKGNLLNGEATNETVESLSKSNYMIICGGSTVYEESLPLCSEVIMHFTKQDYKDPGDNPSYFPIQLLNQLFRPETVNEFETFTQIFYVKRDA